MEVMARYGEGAYVAWKMGRIMLKYRPIAPKPVTGGAVTVGSVNVKSNRGRGKRKGGLKDGTRGRKRGKREVAGVFLENELKKINDNNNNNNSNSLLSATEVITLPLMPVTPERKEESPVGTPSPTASDGHVAINYWEKISVYQTHMSELDYKTERDSAVKHTKLPESCLNSYISFSGLSGRIASGTQNKNTFLESATNSNEDSSNSNSNSSGGANIVTPRPVRPVGSWVMVESVTDTWREREVPLPTLEYDECPSFVSDGCDRVTWTNVAYKRMVVGSTGGGEEEEDEVRVALVTRGMVPRDFGMCFTCSARVKHVCRERGKVSMVVPCDVWRLGGGRLAWRLDVKAALSLSLGCEM